MSDSPQPSRPQQVTTAVVLSVVACVLVVANLLSTRAELRGTSFRDTLAEAQERAGGVGLSTEQLVAALDVLVFVSGALAAAAGVLAVYVWHRNRAAWIAFFVLAGLLVLTLPVAGVMPVLMLAVGAAFLASRPVREWFSGREPVLSGGSAGLSQEAGDPPAGRPEPPPYPGRFGGGAGSGVSAAPTSLSKPTPSAGGPGPSAQPPEYGPWHGAGGQQGPGQPYGQGYPPHPSRDPDKRPATVTAACVVTWLGTALVATLVGLIALVLVADRTRFLREFQRQADDAQLQVTQSQILAVTWTMVGIGLFWCLAAAVLAVAAFRRSRAGRVGLAVSAGMTVLISLLLILSFVAVVPLLLGAAVLVLLFTGGANDWYAGRRPHQHHLPPGPSWGPPAGPPAGPPSGPPYQQDPGQQQPPQPYGQQYPPPPPPGRAKPW